MKSRAFYQPPGVSSTGTDYEEIFITQAHKLVALGYESLIPQDYVDTEEETITGALVSAIRHLCDNPSAPAWLDVFNVREELPVNTPHLTGKRRPIVDIEIEYSQYRPRPRLSFEAKRLGPKHGGPAYLGAEGLGRFLTGKYAADSRAGAMLGYVQQGQPAEWAKKIGQAIAKNATQLALRPSSPWSPHPLAPRLRHTYRSGHDRPTLGSPIEI